jgi:hypothetical protein
MTPNFPNPVDTIDRKWSNNKKTIITNKQVKPCSTTEIATGNPHIRYANPRGKSGNPQCLIGLQASYLLPSKEDAYGGGGRRLLLPVAAALRRVGGGGPCRRGLGRG